MATVFCSHYAHFENMRSFYLFIETLLAGQAMSGMYFRYYSWVWGSSWCSDRIHRRCMQHYNVWIAVNADSLLCIRSMVYVRQSYSCHKKKCIVSPKCDWSELGRQLPDRTWNDHALHWQDVRGDVADTKRLSCHYGTYVSQSAHADWLRVIKWMAETLDARVERGKEETFVFVSMACRRNVCFRFWASCCGIMIAAIVIASRGTIPLHTGREFLI